MTATETPSAPVILAEVVRSGFVEGRHLGSFVIVQPDGAVDRARGDVVSPIFPRSSNKLMQATGMVECGFDGPSQHLALAASSHSGEPMHIAVVREILASAGLPEDSLRTPPGWPLNDDAMRAVSRAGGDRARILMNCSGKHSAMLATCVVNDWPTDDYRDPAHPLQQRIRDTIARLSGQPVLIEGVDGCGAPVAALSLTALARAFSVAVQAESGSPERRVADSMRAHPELVGGSDRDVTAFMSGVSGLLAKDGAEAVMAAALPDGRAFALKILDGGDRARPVVTAALLRHLGVGVDASAARVLEQYEVEPLFGGGVRVGEIRPAALF
ncbi:MAG: asparaginase [Actinomycetes bacterium]